MTSDTKRCDYYKAESANVKDRYYCQIDLGSLGKERHFEHYFRRNPVPITKEDCEVCLFFNNSFPMKEFLQITPTLFLS